MVISLEEEILPEPSTLSILSLYTDPGLKLVNTTTWLVLKSEFSGEDFSITGLIAAPS